MASGTEFAVAAVINGVEGELSRPFRYTTQPWPNVWFKFDFDNKVLTRNDYRTKFVWPMDLDGNGEFDAVVVDRLFAGAADNDDAEIGKIGVNFFIPGTFNMDGTNVQTVCNAKDAQVKISQLELKDAEMKAAMAASEETRNAMFKLIEAEVKNNGAAEISKIGELATLFKVFKVKFDGNDKMKIFIGDEAIGFDRVK
jgi:hypothetical protein